MRIAPAWMLAATVGFVSGCGPSATRSPDGTGRSQIDVPSQSRRPSEPIRPATAARRPVNPDRFEITALPDTYAEPSPTFWIDDARLVFAALAPDSPLKAEQRVYLRYVWNVLTGRIVQTYGVAERPIWCFSDGYSSYVVHAGREAIMYGGGFGSEAEILRYAVDTPSEQRPRQNEFDCRPSRAGKLNFDPQKGRRLYGDDGYIGRAPQSDVGAPRQLAFYR